LRYNFIPWDLGNATALPYVANNTTSSLSSSIFVFAGVGVGGSEKAMDILVISCRK